MEVNRERTHLKRSRPWVDQFPRSSCGASTGTGSGIQCQTRLEIVERRSELGLRGEGHWGKEARRLGDH
jgi:hypothetical protein